MKKVININLAGRLVPIEDTAYESLKDYLEKLSTYFSREEGGEEIVSDIENRISELCQQKLNQSVEFISDRDVKDIEAIMGQPEQLEEETSTEPQEKTADRKKSEEERGQKGRTDEEKSKGNKKLRRNKNDKVLGGVCSGIANYFDIDPVVVRIIAFFLIIVYGTGVLLYLVLWVVVPGAYPESASLKRRLYRDSEHKVIGGVASGLAAYFKIDIIIPRIIFLLPLLGTAIGRAFHHSYYFRHGDFVYDPLSLGLLNSLILLYIILWIVLPKAVTRTEKLEMKGEKVDLESISNAHKPSETEKKK